MIIITSERVFPEKFLLDCVTLLRSDTSTLSHIPLAHLHTFAIQAPQRPSGDPGYWYGNNWFDSLTRLPKLASVEFIERSSLDPVPTFFHDVPHSNFRSLTITNFDAGYASVTIRKALMSCPLLESLDLTSQPEGIPGREPSTWSEIGEVLSRHGSSLRKFRYDNIIHPYMPGLLNVASLRHLQYLAVPVDAFMALHGFFGTRYSGEGVDILTGNRHGFGSVHDIEDLWAQAYWPTMDKDLAAMYEKHTRRIIAEGPMTPFSQLLPDTLQHLRILDDTGTDSVAFFVDEQLKDLVLDPKFPKLRDVQVQREKFFTEHIKPEHLENFGWRVEGGDHWNIMRRL